MKINVPARGLRGRGPARLQTVDEDRKALLLLDRGSIGRESLRGSKETTSNKP